MATRARAAILFDLDGTLVDSITLIVNSARYAFEKLGREWISDAAWREGIGIPLPTMFMRFARDEADRDALIAAYREYQLEHHDRLISCYEHVVETVHELRAHGHELAVVTSKSEWLAYRALALVGLASCMETVVGLDASTRHKPDPEPVWIALQRLNCPPEQALFVGDSVHDVMAGNAAGVATVAATWGAFHRTELEPGNPSHWLESISDLPQLIRDTVQTF
ncbi:MAG TPA: HAD-IA family hydrolase [Gemmatimonadaceae bacterium]|nr:HAD-IA family hydrolase [Gemmatimonadaceae bacterium]